MMENIVPISLAEQSAPFGGSVIRVDATYLYDLGEELRSILRLNEDGTERLDFYLAAYQLKRAIETFVSNSVFSGSLKTLHRPASDLLEKINHLAPDPEEGEEIDWNEQISSWQIANLKSDFKNFEAVLRAELQASSLYHVSSKGGFDTTCLTDAPQVIFPPDIAAKVPEAMVDLSAAARCIAFELPTSAALHLHRANESVLRKYWDSVTNGRAHPDQKNMGVYLRELNNLDVGKLEVREHLKSIKDLHRNPLMHPEESFDTIEQALDLMAAIRCSIGYMLREIN